MSVLHQISSGDMNVTLALSTNHETCNSYQLEKSHRLSVFNEHNRSNIVFDIVHVDLWDPSPTSSTHRMKYFLAKINPYKVIVIVNFIE